MKAAQNVESDGPVFHGGAGIIISVSTNKLTLTGGVADRWQLNEKNSGVPTMPLEQTWDRGRFRSGVTRIAITAAALALAQTVWAACPDFATPVKYGVGTNPARVAIADFNLDGRPDLAVANLDSKNVSILRGNGDGTFTLLGSYSTGTVAGNSPRSVAVADFNGDGKPDLAVTNQSKVVVFLGNGDGTFGAAVFYDADNNAHGLAVGDFNGDGKPDLAATNSSSGRISILLGIGNGTFSPAVNYVAGTSPVFVVTADLNRDGRLDLAVGSFNSNKVSILLGNGNGTFGAASDNDAGPGFAGFFAIGDINGDGKLDLVTANQGFSILTGNGDGTFASQVNYNAGGTASSVSVGDFNGDGKADLVLSGIVAGVTVMLSGADGFFMAFRDPTAAYFHVAFADFNGDGKPDFAAVNAGSDNVSILLNTGVCSANCATFSPAVSYGSTTHPTSVAVGDLNGDGKTDLAVAHGNDNDVTIHLGNGDGTFAAPGDYGTAGTLPVGVTFGDFNRDGKPDLAVANYTSNNVSILLGNGNGAFTAPVNYYPAGVLPQSIAAGDFNGDGKLDLALPLDANASNVSILLGNGSGGFGAPAFFSAGSFPQSIAVGDLNGDGKLDLAVANSNSNYVSILIGNGNGTFGTAVNYDIALPQSAVAIGDFNGDGKPDLAVAGPSTNDVTILLGNGNGTFTVGLSYSAGLLPRSVATGDFNADGKLDLAVANYASNNVSILIGNGNGGFGEPVNYAVGTTPVSVAIGDFNRDGKSDVAVANRNSDNVSILLNTCPAPDLTGRKTHAGNFSQGDAGKTYTITVSNIGTLPSGGAVTVTDKLPAGLTAAAISGPGWSCNLGTLTCSRSDALPMQATYPPITLTVNVDANAAPSVTNTATISGGAEVNTSNDTASDPTAINQSDAPQNLVATAISASQVDLAWDIPLTFDALSYEVFRKSRSVDPYVLVGSPTMNRFTDSGLTADTSYLYEVRAVGIAGAFSPMSNVDLATTIIFTDDPVVAGATVPKAIHLTELRREVIAVRGVVGGALPPFTDAIAPGAVIKAIDILELRSDLDFVRSYLGLSAMFYTNPTLAPGNVIRAAHVNELRFGGK